MGQEQSLQLRAGLTREEIVRALEGAVVSARGVVTVDPGLVEERDPDEYVRPGHEHVGMFVNGEDGDSDDSFVRYVGVWVRKRQYRWLELAFRLDDGRWSCLADLRDIDDRQLGVLGHFAALVAEPGCDWER